jgi:hypothetical protein
MHSGNLQYRNWCKQKGTQQRDVTHKRSFSRTWPSLSIANSAGGVDIRKRFCGSQAPRGIQTNPTNPRPYSAWHRPPRTTYGTSRRVASCWAWGSWGFSCSVREIAVERLIFDRSDQQDADSTEPHTPRQPPSAPPTQAHGGRGAGGPYWVICWLFYVPYKIFRHSGPRLYPLIKPVGLQMLRHTHLDAAPRH